LERWPFYFTNDSSFGYVLSQLLAISFGGRGGDGCGEVSGYCTKTRGKFRLFYIYNLPVLDDIRSILDCSRVEMEGDVMAPELTYS
jgi:hypothetical protein